MVLLFSWVPQNPLASTTVFSYGDRTFDGSGLTPGAIQETIDTSVRSLVEQERPFEALVYLMRETRYNGIYAPPPPALVEGGAKATNGAVRLAKPDSWFAKRRYPTPSRRRTRAEKRFGPAYVARWNRLKDLVGGTPDPTS